MKIKVSHEFAQYVNRLVKETGIAERAYFTRVSSINYPGGTLFNPDSDLDYDSKYDNYKVIEVVYPEDYHACATTISTPWLMQEVNRYNVTTEEGLRVMLRDMIEV